MLRARFSHSRGSFGGRRLRAIDDSAPSQRRRDDQVGIIAIALDFFGHYHNDIDRSPRAAQAAIDCFDKHKT